MEADVLNALQCQPAYFPGGRDRDGRPLILIPVPSELQPWTKRYLEIAIKYLLSTLRLVLRTFEIYVFRFTDLIAKFGRQCWWGLFNSVCDRHRYPAMSIQVGTSYHSARRNADRCCHSNSDSGTPRRILGQAARRDLYQESQERRGKWI